MTINPYYPTVLPLRKKLEKLLQPFLGKYGTNIPAIWVEPPSTPKQAVTGGFECVIRRYKNVSSTELLINHQSHDTFEWIIIIKTSERTIEAYNRLDKILEIMRKNFPYRRETIGNFTEANTLQVTYRIPEEEVYNTVI